MIPHKSTESEWISLVDLLRCRAAAVPESDLFAFLPDSEDGPAATITRGELDRRARALAVRLQDLGVDSGRAYCSYTRPGSTSSWRSSAASMPESLPSPLICRGSTGR